MRLKGQTKIILFYTRTSSFYLHCTLHISLPEECASMCHELTEPSMQQSKWVCLCGGVVTLQTPERCFISVSCLRSSACRHVLVLTSQQAGAQDNGYSLTFKIVMFCKLAAVLHEPFWPAYFRFRFLCWCFIPPHFSILCMWTLKSAAVLFLSLFVRSNQPTVGCCHFTQTWFWTINEVQSAWRQN